MAWNTHLFSQIMSFCCCRFQSRIARWSSQGATEMTQNRETQTSSQNKPGAALRETARLHIHLRATTSALITWFLLLHYKCMFTAPVGSFACVLGTFDSSQQLESFESVHQNDSFTDCGFRSVVFSAGYTRESWISRILINFAWI